MGGDAVDDDDFVTDVGETVVAFVVVDVAVPDVVDEVVDVVDDDTCVLVVGFVVAGWC